MKKSFFVSILTLCFLFSMGVNCFGYGRIDGNIDMEEADSSKVELLCKNGNSGNKVNKLISYYNIDRENKEIYLAVNMEFLEEINDESDLSLHIYIDKKPMIEIKKSGDIISDKKYFNVQSKVKSVYSNVKVESKITYKFLIDEAPDIFIQICDSDGSNSKLFDIDTFIPAPIVTTSEETNYADKKDEDEKSEIKHTNNKRKKKSDNNKSKSSGKKHQSENLKESEKSKSKEASTTEKKDNIILNDDEIESDNEANLYIRAISVAASIGLIISIVATSIFVNVKSHIANSENKDD